MKPEQHTRAPRALRILPSALLVLVCITSAANAADTNVSMVNFQFSPKDIAVNAGDTVTWVNQDNTFHDTTSGTNAVPSGLWHSALPVNGDSFSFTFNVPGGYYGYYCTPHVFLFHMFGSVTVIAPDIPPSVTITSPVDGAMFPAGANILIEAAASDQDGTVARVDFSVNGNPAGSVATRPYSLTLTNVAAGNYALRAVAVDDQGTSSTPAQVNVVVVQGNIPPSVTIANPVNGQAFFAGTNVLIEADASDSDGFVKQVEFFVNDVSLGTRTTPPYSIEITNLAIGDYSLHAVATDDQNASSTSPAVVISVATAPLPPTIITPPQSLTTQVGSSATFSVAAGGTSPLTYQWQFNGANAPAATNTSFTLSNLQTNDSGDYSVVVSNIVGVVTSTPAILLVYLPATIVIASPTNGAEFQAPANVTASVDSTANGIIAQVRFFLSQDGSATNLVAIKTNPPFSLVLSNRSAGTYLLSAAATDIFGGSVASSAVQFIVRNPPVLTRSPADASVPPGTAILLQASVDTNGPVVTRVNFFENGFELGEDIDAPFSFTFQTNLLGDFSFTAVAIDLAGYAFTSAPVALRISVPENIRPTITITSSPPNFFRTNSPQVRLSGIATDNSPLDHVEYQINGGQTGLASGTTAWTLVANLLPGPNTVRVRSVDLRTNSSFDATRFFTYVVKAPLAVQIDTPEMGSVLPDLTRGPLEIGKVYSATARARPGFIFTGWEGVPVTNNPILTFEMVPDLTNLTAHFSTNPFPAVAGTYTGVFLDTNHHSVETSGFLNLKIGAVGSFSGKLSMQGKSYPFHGQFYNPSNASLPVIRPALKPVVLGLDLDPGGRLRGFVTNSVGTNLVISQLMAERNIFDRITNISPQTGIRHFVLKRDPGSNTDPLGMGKVVIHSGGIVQSSGMLSDRRKFNFSSTLGSTGDSSLYLSLSKGTEVIVGTFHFGPGPGPFVGGDFYWVGPGTNNIPLVAEPAP